jgi:hypothetical protein
MPDRPQNNPARKNFGQRKAATSNKSLATNPEPLLLLLPALLQELCDESCPSRLAPIPAPLSPWNYS